MDITHPSVDLLALSSPNVRYDRTLIPPLPVLVGRISFLSKSRKQAPVLDGMPPDGRSCREMGLLPPTPRGYWQSSLPISLSPREHRHPPVSPRSSSTTCRSITFSRLWFRSQISFPSVLSMTKTPKASAYFSLPVAVRVNVLL